MVSACALLMAQGPQQPGSRDLLFEQMDRGAALDGSGRQWAVVIGVSQYRNVPQQAQLRFAHRDAQEFARFLTSPNGGSFPPEQIRLLLNENATLAAMRTALGTWLPRSAGPNDTIYIYFAGHGVVESEREGYLMAHDSDLQNLYATALGFTEMERIVAERLSSQMVFLIADACHSGAIGWSENTSQSARNVNRHLEALGSSRSIVRMLAARPEELSFEDERWGGGHGVFTFSLLEGLRGHAERERDGVVRLAEVAEYVTSRVPNETRTLQHPTVSGSREGARPLALLRTPNLRPSAAPAAPSPLVAEVDRKLAAGQLLGAQGAFESYRQLAATSPNDPHRTRIEIALAEALETIGQRAVNDYVQPTGPALKRGLLARAAEAYRYLMVLRPEPSVEAKKLFAEGRLRILEERPAEGAALLRRSIALDPRNACSHAALGVALEKLGDNDAALESFRNAAARAPEWSLPRVQLATQLQTRKQFDRAIDEVRAAISFYPLALQPRWMLVRLLRTVNRLPEAEKAASDIIGLNANYAPVYVELGQIYEAQQRYEHAADAYAAYVQLAPNFSDTAAVRARAAQIRGIAGRRAPSLLRDKN
jgi:uncharacterized caspase-like protein/cytochrome c-type biogenesis protein CcmH/NrfG